MHLPHSCGVATVINKHDLAHLSTSNMSSYLHGLLTCFAISMETCGLINRLLTLCDWLAVNKQGEQKQQSLGEPSAR